MKYIHFTGSNGYCGCEYEEWMELEDDTSEEEIGGISYDLAVENAELFSHVAFGWDEEPEPEEYDEYIEGTLGYCTWEEVSKEEYDNREV